jgi:hypothetical protein
MLAFITNATSTVLHRKLTLPASRTSSRGVQTALSLLLQVGSAAILVAAGFVVQLPPLFGEWQQAAQYALSLLWVVGAINAVHFLGRPRPLAATRRVYPRVVHHRPNGRRTVRSTRLAR